MENSTPCVPQKPDAKLEKGPRGCRAIAFLSVFSTWYTTVLVDLLHEEEEPGIGVQAGALLFHDFDFESDDTDHDDFDAPSPVIECVAPHLLLHLTNQLQ